MRHVVIVGAGIVGACLAFRLGQRGVGVTVIDGLGRARGATGSSFGWINASFFADQAHFALRSAGIAAHRRLAAELGSSPVRWPGCLWFEEQGAGLEAMARTLVGLGYPVERMTGAQVRERVPALGVLVQEALVFPSEGAVDAADLTERLLAASGAQVWQGADVQGVEVSGGRAVGVRLAQGIVVADHVILAAGSGTAGLLAPLGGRLPMQARPGLILTTAPVPPVLPFILAAPGQELRQDKSGRLIAPAVAGHQGDSAEVVTEVPGTLADGAMARIGAMLPGVKLRWTAVSLAKRPVPGDGLPVVGAGPVDALSVAVMHSGVTLAPIVAEALVGEILDEVEDPLLATFRPGRF